jgi:nucleoside-diphosphate-sugar epimerase
MREIQALANPDPANSRLLFGCGYLGRRVAARWLARGRCVYATTRRRATELSSLGVAPRVADVTEPATLRDLPNCGAAVYCVGYDRHAGHSMRKVYVQGLANVLAVTPGCDRFIYVSSAGVYGDAAGDWVDETTPVNPTDEAGSIVCAAEQLLRRLRPDAMVLRFAGIYGPGRLLRRVESLQNGEPIAADPDKWLNLIHVEDGASAVLAAEQHGRPGEVYNVADRPVRRRDFFARLAEILGARPPVFRPEEASRDRGNRRISNKKMCDDLRVVLQHASYQTGLEQANR